MSQKDADRLRRYPDHAMTITTAQLAKRYGRAVGTVLIWVQRWYIEPTNPGRGNREPYQFDAADCDQRMAAHGTYPVRHKLHVEAKAAKSSRARAAGVGR